MSKKRQIATIFDAVRVGDIQLLSDYLDCGGDPNASENKTGERLLCIAAQNGDLKSGQLLLEHGADPNLPTYAWPIHFAAGRGHLDFVELLLQSGSEVHCLDEDGGTPLADAAAGGHHKVVELLLEAGADPTYRDSYGKRPILYAAEKGHQEIVELLKHYSSANEVQLAELRLRFAGSENLSEAFSRAKMAAYSGDLAGVRQYIETGGDPNCIGLGGGTLLMSAAKTGRMEILSYLIQHGANPNLVEENGACALSYTINAQSSAPYELLFPLTDEKLRRRVERDKEKRKKAGFLKW